MKPYLVLVALGAGLAVTAAWIGGRGAGIGGAAALLAQLWAVALLRPAMRGPNPAFMARWLGGMLIRAVGLGLVVLVGALRPRELALLPAVLGYLGVLLPLLFTETRFLR